MSSPPESFYPDSKTAKAQRYTGTLTGVLSYRAKSRKQDSKCHKEWEEIPLWFFSFPPRPLDAIFMAHQWRRRWQQRPQGNHSEGRKFTLTTGAVVPRPWGQSLLLFFPQFLCFLVPKQRQSWELWSRPEKVRFASLAEVLEKAERVGDRGNCSEIVEGREMKKSIPGCCL